ncbi:hypothetical protein Tco_1218293 [Tanacetum coccineum]
MVACLEKSEENVEFHQVVDFLSTCSINYALTVSPTIYASYIEHFWNTATSKIVNSVKQIHAIIDGKAVVISESSVRSDLHFNDEDGKVTPLFESMLVQNQAPKSEGSATPPEPQPTPSTLQPHVSEPQTEPLQTETPPPDLGADEVVHKEGVTVWKGLSLLLLGNGYRWQSQAPRHHGGAPAQTRSERVLEKPNKPPLSEGGNTAISDEGRMELIKELMETCTLLTKRVLALEEAKNAQDRVINRLKFRVKRLEKKRKARTPQPMKRRLFKGRVETSTDTSLGEDASKQGRSSDKTKPMFTDSDFDVLDAEQITTTGPSHVSTADQVGTARPEVSVATPSTPPTTTTVFDDEDVTMAMAQTLIKMKEVKAKEKGVEFRNVEEATRPVRSITTLQHLPKIDLKYKGKSVLVEEEPKKVKSRDQGLAQIESDVELAQILHEEELAELDKAQIERQRQEEATNAALTEEFDEIQARIDVDALFAAKLQQE